MGVACFVTPLNAEKVEGRYKLRQKRMQNNGNRGNGLIKTASFDGSSQP